MKKYMTEIICTLALCCSLVGCGNVNIDAVSNKSDKSFEENTDKKTDKNTVSPTETLDITTKENSSDITYRIEGEKLIFSGKGTLTASDVTKAKLEHKSSFKYVVIEEGITHIGRGTFDYFRMLESIELPDTLVSIGDHAFDSCWRMLRITIPESVVDIGEYAFSRCSALFEINIPAGVKEIKKMAFSYCNSLDTLILPEGLETIGDGAFFYSGISSLVVPESVTSIGDYVFEGCSYLRDIIIPPSVTSIGDWVYSRSGIGINETIPDHVTSIGKGSFWGLHSCSIYIPDSVTVIKQHAFDMGTSIEYNDGSDAERYDERYQISERIREGSFMADVNNFEQYVGSTISGAELDYYLSTMKSPKVGSKAQTYALLISCESFLNLKETFGSDTIVPVIKKSDKIFDMKHIKSTVTGMQGVQFYHVFGHALTSLGRIEWNPETNEYSVSASLKNADSFEFITDEVTGGKIKSIEHRMFLPWEHRKIFEDTDMFYVYEITSKSDGSLLGYVFEQTTLEYVE